MTFIWLIDQANSWAATWSLRINITGLKMQPTDMSSLAAVALCAIKHLAVRHLTSQTRAVPVTFSTMHLKSWRIFPCCIPHRPGISWANKPAACHISMEVLLPPGEKIPNHSFPFLNWHSEAKARKRLVNYKKETGRGNWLEKWPLMLPGQLTNWNQKHIKSDTMGCCFSGINSITKCSTPFLQSCFNNLPELLQSLTVTLSLALSSTISALQPVKQVLNRELNLRAQLNVISSDTIVCF